jgi:hypothetical protein
VFGIIAASSIYNKFTDLPRIPAPVVAAVNTIEPFLRDVQAKRGISDYVVIADESNNTAAVIDSNEFRADIYIKPARSINFIGLTFIATKSGVDFEEVIGNF